MQSLFRNMFNFSLTWCHLILTSQSFYNFTIVSSCYRCQLYSFSAFQFAHFGAWLWCILIENQTKWKIKDSDSLSFCMDWGMICYPSSKSADMLSIPIPPSWRSVKFPPSILVSEIPATFYGAPEGHHRIPTGAYLVFVRGSSNFKCWSVFEVR